MFKRGYNSVKEEKERQEREAEKRKSGLFRFFLGKDGDEADILFLTEEPVTFEEHIVPRNKNGKTYYDNIPCMGEGCDLCADGDRPRFVGAYLIVDRRETEYKDQKTGKMKTNKDQVRLYVQGTRVLSQLDRLSEKYGLTNRVYTIVRTGSGVSTTYTFERGDSTKLSAKEIESLLPESLRASYDGTMSSLYDIVESQIEMLISPSDDSEKEPVRTPKVVNLEEEEKGEERPSKKSGGAKSLMKNLKKRNQQQGSDDDDMPF